MYLVVGVQKGVVVLLERLGHGAVGREHHRVVLAPPGRRSLQMTLQGGDQLVQGGSGVGAHG